MTKVILFFVCSLLLTHYRPACDDKRIQQLARNDRQDLRQYAENERCEGGCRPLPVGRRSAASTASETSLPNAPQSADMIANAPANGPRWEQGPSGSMNATRVSRPAVPRYARFSATLRGHKEGV